MISKDVEFCLLHGVDEKHHTTGADDCCLKELLEGRCLNDGMNCCIYIAWGRFGIWRCICMERHLCLVYIWYFIFEVFSVHEEVCQLDSAQPQLEANSHADEAFIGLIPRI